MRPVLETLKSRHAENFGWAQACCAFRHDLAEDVLQEAYLRVLDGRARFSGRSSPGTWFFAVIRRVASEMQRRQTRHAALDMRLVVAEQGAAGDALSDAGAAPDGNAEREQVARQLQQALLQLPTRQREVLHLVFYAECTVEEAATVLRISVGSARTHYQRGKSRLAQLLLVGE